MFVHVHLITFYFDHSNVNASATAVPQSASVNCGEMRFVFFVNSTNLFSGWFDVLVADSRRQQHRCCL